MSKLSDEQKQAALEAGKQGMKDAYEKSKTKTGLKWWERLLWVVRKRRWYAKTAPASSLSRGIFPIPRRNPKRTFRPSFNP